MYNYINETRKYLSYVQTLLEWGGHNSWFYKKTKYFKFQFMNLRIDKNNFLIVYPTKKC